MFYLIIWRHNGLERKTCTEPKDFFLNFTFLNINQIKKLASTCIGYVDDEKVKRLTEIII